MSSSPLPPEPPVGGPRHYSASEQKERLALGLPPTGRAAARAIHQPPTGREPVAKTPMRAADVLNEAPCYGAAFPRGLRVDLPGGVTHLVISGTASVGPEGQTLYPGDFRAQLWRTFHNLTRLLEAEEATWHDVVRTTCYIRDIERDYDEFNDVRNEFYHALGLDPLPASTGIQARICRSDLLVEIEVLAILVR